MSKMTLEEMEVEVLRFGTRLNQLDAIVAAERLGRPKTLAFRCAHSGLYFPPTYIKDWGRITGIGLGPEPVSECLDTVYDGVTFPLMDRVRDVEALARPHVVTMAQLDLSAIPVEEYEASRLILAIDDPDVEERGAILLEKQIAKDPDLRIKVLEFRKKGGR